MRNLNDWIETTTAPGFATEENARRKVEKVMDGWTMDGASTLFIQRKRDGRWLPVVINPDSFFIKLVHAGICVWG